MHEFMPLEPFLGFLQQTCPINYFRSKTYVLGGFAPFCCCTGPVAKISIKVHLKHEFVPPKPFLFSRNEHAQSTTLGLKTGIEVHLMHEIMPPELFLVL